MGLAKIHCLFCRTWAAINPLKYRQNFMSFLRYFENLYNWHLQICVDKCTRLDISVKPYLGANPEQYFSCPKHPLSEGKTSYALVQYDNTTTNNDTLDTILLIELSKAVPFDEAVVSVDDVLDKYLRNETGLLRQVSLWGLTAGDERETDLLHGALRSGAVRAMSSIADDEELLRLLGQD